MNKIKELILSLTDDWFFRDLQNTSKVHEVAYDVEVRAEAGLYYLSNCKNWLGLSGIILQFLCHFQRVQIISDPVWDTFWILNHTLD